MSRPLKLALVLVAVALVLGILGLVLRALRWLLYVAIFVLLLAAAARWLVGSDRAGGDPPAR